MTSTLKTRLFRAGFSTLAALRADVWLPAVTNWRGVVLTMHRVRPAPTEGFAPNAHLEITPEFLELAVGRLRRRGIALVGIDEAEARLAAGDRERFAVLTFDDGYADNHDVAWPILNRLGVPFTVFVASGMVDGTASAWWITLEEVLRRAAAVDFAGTRRRLASDADRDRAFRAIARRLRALGEAERDAAVRALAAAAGVDIPALLAREMMDWDAVRRLAADPLVTIGGHTVDHPSLAALSTEEARREIVGGLDRIEAETGRRPRHFAYPYGSPRDVSLRDVELARSLGLEVAVTTSAGMLSGTGRSAAWPRVSLNGNFQCGRDLDLLVSGLPQLLDRRRLAVAAG